MARLFVTLTKPPTHRETIISALGSFGEVEQFANIPRSLVVVGPASAVPSILSIPGVETCEVETPNDFKLTSIHDFVPAPVENVGQHPLLIHGHSRANPLWGTFYDLFVADGQTVRYTYDPTVGVGNGNGTNLYFVDNGVLSTHDEFVGRFGSQLQDRHGDGPGTHGTSVASCAAGANLGVAPGATVFDLKGFTVGGSASTSDLTQCLSDALTHFNANSQPGVVNCSFGGQNSSNAYAASIDACVDAGLIVVAAAGNNGLDLDVTAGGDQFWPAEDPDAYTVGGLDSWNRIHKGSNHHGSVDIYALYHMWTTADAGGNSSYMQANRTRGTSFSSPMVAGMISRALTGTTKMTTRQQVQDFLTQFTADYAIEDVTDIDGTPLAGRGRLYIPGVTRTGLVAYTPPTTGL